MTVATCPHCGLSVQVRAAFLAPDLCPRCIARFHVASPMRSQLVRADFGHAEAPVVKPLPS